VLGGAQPHSFNLTRRVRLGMCPLARGHNVAKRGKAVVFKLFVCAVFVGSGTRSTSATRTHSDSGEASAHVLGVVGLQHRSGMFRIGRPSAGHCTIRLLTGQHLRGKKLKGRSTTTTVFAPLGYFGTGFHLFLEDCFLPNAAAANQGTAAGTAE
jgi:hypothetical protein